MWHFLITQKKNSAPTIILRNIGIRKAMKKKIFFKLYRDQVAVVLVFLQTVVRMAIICRNFVIALIG
jgi:hypothetical protein